MDRVLIGDDMKPATISELIAHWRLQEALFQGYRRLFITLEFGFLSVATLSITLSPTTVSVFAQGVVLLTMLLLAAATNLVLSPIIRKRGEVVFFWQAAILRAEQGIEVVAPLTSMKEFQKNGSEVQSWPEYHSLRTGKNLTRRKLNNLIPLVVSMSWIVMILLFSFEKADIWPSIFAFICGDGFR